MMELTHLPLHIQKQAQFQFQEVEGIEVVDRMPRRFKQLIRRLCQSILRDPELTRRLWFIGETGAGKGTDMGQATKLIVEQDALRDKVHIRTVSSAACMKNGRALGLVTSPHPHYTEDEFAQGARIGAAAALHGAGNLKIMELAAVYRFKDQGVPVFLEPITRAVTNVDPSHRINDYAVMVVTVEEIMQAALDERRVLRQLEQAGAVQSPDALLRERKIELDMPLTPEVLSEFNQGTATDETIEKFVPIMNQLLVYASQAGYIRNRHLTQRTVLDWKKRMRAQSDFYKVLAVQEFGFLPENVVVVPGAYIDPKSEEHQTLHVYRKLIKSLEYTPQESAQHLQTLNQSE